MFLAITGMLASSILLMQTLYETYRFYTTETNTYFDITAFFFLVMPAILLAYNFFAYKIFRTDKDTVIRKIFFDSTFLFTLALTFFSIYLYGIVIIEGHTKDNFLAVYIIMSLAIPWLFGINVVVNTVAYFIRKTSGNKIP